MIERYNIQVYIFTRNPDLKILLLKRTPQRSGYWQPVCGGIEIGEDLKKAAVREVREETGLTYSGEMIDLNYIFSYKEPKNGVVMTMQDTCYAIEVAKIFDVLLSEEHEQYQWCTITEALKLATWEHTHTALSKLQTLIL